MDLVYVRHRVGEIAPKISPKPIPYYDLTVVIKGELDYVIDGEKIHLESGDLIFISEGAVRMRLESETEVDYISFNFNCDREIRLPLHLKNAVHSDALLLIAAYDKIGVSPYFDNKEKNEHLLACLISVLEDRAERQRFSPLTLKIMKYIRQNMDNKITLEDISKLTFFSSVYCDTVFKRETGSSIIDYLLDVRVDEAKKLLLEGTMSLREISESVGFNDYNYFSRVFKARTGYPPSAYRRMVFGGGEG